MTKLQCIKLLFGFILLQWLPCLEYSINIFDINNVITFWSVLGFLLHRARSEILIVCLFFTFLTPHKGKWLLGVCHLTMEIFCCFRYNQVLPSENSFAKYVECCMGGAELQKNCSAEILGNTETPQNSLGKLLDLRKPWVLILIKLHSLQKVIPRCLMTP